MLVETPFWLASVPDSVKETLAWTQGKDWLGKYTCEGVKLANLLMKLKEVDGKANITAMIVLANPHSNDKRVTVACEVLNGDEVIAKFGVAGVKVEETDSVERKAKFAVPRAQLIKDTTKLRIKITVTNG
jgi:hypothetical protein